MSRAGECSYYYNCLSMNERNIKNHRSIMSRAGECFYIYDCSSMNVIVREILWLSATYYPAMGVPNET